MKPLESPQVYLIAQPQINVEGIKAYLHEVGGQEWYERVVAPNLLALNHAATLTEIMGRICYRSWVPGLNKNVTKIREDQDGYILNILKSGHGSVLARAWFSFIIRGGSRVFTAEMNRHGVGTAISEQSLRYVRLEEVEFWEPTGLSPVTIAEGREVIAAFEEFYSRAVERELSGVKDFDTKKKVTSTLRRWAPMGLATEEGWSGNIRSVRHVLEMRTVSHAEEEIRLIANGIGEHMARVAPAFFQDYGFTEDSPPAWVTENKKV